MVKMKDKIFNRVNGVAQKCFSSMVVLENCVSGQSAVWSELGIFAFHRICGEIGMCLCRSLSEEGRRQYPLRVDFRIVAEKSKLC